MYMDFLVNSERAFIIMLGGLKKRPFEKMMQVIAEITVQNINRSDGE